MLLLEIYLHLPPIIPYLTGFQIFSSGFRTVYNTIGILYGIMLGQFSEFSIINSIFLGATWVTTTIYVIADTFFGVPLPPRPVPLS